MQIDTPETDIPDEDSGIIPSDVFVMDDHNRYFRAYEVKDSSCVGCCFNGAGCQRPNNMDFVCEDVGSVYKDIIWKQATRKQWYDSYGQ